MDPTLKHPPNRKRHTKPCMFYQTMQCPFSADECDFAHVITAEETAPTHPNDTTQTNHRTKVCRYFAMGSCAQGMWCRFKHPASGVLEGSYAEEGPVPPAQFGHSDHGSLGDAREGANIFTQGDKKKFHKRPSPMIAVPSAPAGYFSAPAWSPYGQSVGIASHALPPFYIPHNLLSPTTMHDSAESPFAMPETPSSSDQSSTASDDLIVTMDDLHLSQQTTPSTAKTPPPVPTGPSTATIPFYVPRNSPVALHVLPATRQPGVDHNDSLSRSASRTGRDRSQSQPHTRTKNQSYKTKPCKFYKANSICPMGEKCTFIHDLSIKPAHTKQASLGSERMAPVHDLENTTKVPHELPSKPVSVHDENRKKGYFPISWRVIGGGVPLGGKRPACPSYFEGYCTEGDDCKLSHDDRDGHANATDLSDSIPDVSEEMSAPSAFTDDGSPSQSDKGDMAPAILLTSPDESDLTTESDLMTDDESCLGTASLMPKATPRQRPISMSIPASPRPDKSRLFSSAESPGGL